MEVVRELGRQDAAAAEFVLREALARFKRVVFATHVPPSREAVWRARRSEDYLPWYGARAMAEMLERVAVDCPDRELVVLSGHVHHAGEDRP